MTMPDFCGVVAAFVLCSLVWHTWSQQVNTSPVQDAGPFGKDATGYLYDFQSVDRLSMNDGSLDKRATTQEDSTFPDRRQEEGWWNLYPFGERYYDIDMVDRPWKDLQIDLDFFFPFYGSRFNYTFCRFMNPGLYLSESPANDIFGPLVITACLLVTTSK
ncbi:unnamed protein product [Soboliphyme baturini]|uniref:PKD_channel domain-containing protein n=1 Tax=Soboliphyme baturini TaxID=241478 RepID=A0A183IMZ3_9BILA|nr:unnamed protein product [Soboliphyme baturini]